MTPAERWVLRRHTQPDPRLRLFCLPHAGGDTWMFADWHLALPPSVEVCPVRLPGRGSRMSDPPVGDAEALARAVADGIDALIDRPFAIFGHSMGALVGLVLARRLRRARGVEPALLCAAACRAPDMMRLDPAISHLPPYIMLAALRRRFGRDSELTSNEELMRLMLPTLRADLALCETLPDLSADPLACPVAAYGGGEDGAVTVAQLEAWQDHTTGPFRIHVMDGDHFFPIGRRDSTLAVLAGDLEWALARLGEGTGPA